MCGSRARDGQGSKALKGEVVQGIHGRKRSSKEGMWIGKKREVVEKGRDVLGGARGPVRAELKSERFCWKGAKSAARRARPARPPEGRRAKE